ncbi:MAG: cyclic pyranopterin monophosphate synthase MoaC [Acidimicrobiales bacterium]
MTEREPAYGVALAMRGVARACITMRPETARAVATHGIKKGDVLGAARFAGLQAAKDTASYLPLLDPEPVSQVVVEFSVGEDHIEVTTSVSSTSKASARMRALSGATVATLTIYDMCKSADRTMRIGPVVVLAPLTNEVAPD